MMTSARSLFLCAALAAALAACGVEKSAQEHLESAQTFINSGDSASATLELKNALQKDASLAEARWLLGSIYLDMGDAASAEKELERAMWLEWAPDDTVPAYALSLVLTGKYEEVIKLDNKVLTDPAMASLYTSQGIAYTALGRNSDARKRLAQALALDPEFTRAQVALAQLNLNMGDTKAAAKTLESIVEANPQNVSAWLAKGDTHAANGQTPRALHAYGQALKIDPNNIHALEQRTRLALQSGELKIAEQGARKLLRSAPKNPGANFLQGILDLQAERYEQAEKRLAMAEPVREQYPMQGFYYAMALLANGKLEMAAAQASRYHALVPESVNGRKLLATIRLQEQDFQQVEELLLPVVREFPNDVGAMRLLANALLRQGRSEEGIALLARVTQLEPESARAQIGLGAGLLLQGEADSAQAHIETALELDPQYQQGELLLVLALLEQQDYEGALASARELVANTPDDVTAHNLVAWVQGRSGDKDAAKATYEATLQRFPGDPGASHSLARMAVEAGDDESARKYYQGVLQHNPDHLAASLQLALLEAQGGDGPAAQRRLEATIEAHPEALQPRLLLARYHLSQGEPEKVDTVLTGLSDSQRKDKGVLQITAIAQLAQHEHSQALFTLEQLNNTNPGSVDYHYLAAMAAAGTGDAEKTEAELRQTLALDPGHFRARLTLARLLLRQDRQKEFEQVLASLAEEFADDGNVLLLQSSAAAQAGNNAQASEFAQRAFEAAPSTATVMALGRALRVAGEADRAAAVYEDWLQQYPEDARVHMQAANDALAQNGSQAIRHYSAVLENQPDNIIALNNLAWLLRETQPEKALAHARRAGELAPDNPSVLDTLAMVQLVSGDSAQASRTIDNALQLAPEQPTILYHRAVIARASGDNSKARSTLEALLGSGVDFPERSEAQELLGALQ